MRVVVTGSSGTIGTRLCESLLEMGHDVIGVDMVPNRWNEKVQAVTHVADLRNASAMDAVSGEGVDAIVHLAANARVHDLVLDPSRALDNVATVFNTLEWARKNDVKRFFFASSRECYGNVKVERYTEDQARIENCESPYTASKIAGEALVHSYRRCYQMQTVIFRFSNVYGAYDLSDRVVPLFIERARKQLPLVIFGEQKCLDFTYIDDTVNGIIQAVEKADAVNGRVFNLAFGEGTTLRRLAEAVKELTGSPSPIEVKSPRVGEIFHYVADITAAKEMLGYSPKVSFEEGIKKSVAWYLEHDPR